VLQKPASPDHASMFLRKHHRIARFEIILGNAIFRVASQKMQRRALARPFRLKHSLQIFAAGPNG
jgi:hypothetical protein